VPLDEAYREHSAVLFRYLVRLTGDADMAADVVQDTFIRFSQAPPHAPDPRGWLYRVATNLVRERRRTEGRRRSLLAGGVLRLPMADAPDLPDAWVEQQEARTAVRAALDTLGERERMLLLMRADGFAYREIAEVLGTTTESIGTMLIRAMRKLSRELTSAHGGES
jgi:RNA polymerase sigma-70 factor (ECF subfamily)